MNYKLNMLPYGYGGTCFLDFEPEYQPIMEQAIMETGREDLVICSKSYINPGYCSLHLISDNSDLNDVQEACARIVKDKEL